MGDSSVIVCIHRQSKHESRTVYEAENVSVVHFGTTFISSKQEEIVCNVRCGFGLTKRCVFGTIRPLCTHIIRRNKL